MLLKRTRWLVGASGLLVAFSAQAQTSQTPQKAANQAGQSAQQAGQSAQQAGQSAQQAGQAAQQAGEAAQQAGQATQQSVQQGMQQGQQGQTSGQTEPSGAEPAMPQTTSPGTSGQPSGQTGTPGQTGQTGMAGEATKPEAGTCREAEDKVEFGFNSASPDAGERKKLDEVASWLAADPHRSVIVKASTDQKGSAKYNEDLSFRRAQSVATGLIGRGVDPARVVAVGEGKAPPEGEPPAEQRSATLMLCQAPAMAAAPAAEPTPAEPAPPPEPAPAEPAPLAQAEPTEPTTTTPYQEPSAVQAAAPERPSGLAGIGVGFDLGGGVIGFTDKQASRLSHVGGSWDVRLSFGTRLPLALEAAYVGSAQNVANLNGISTSALLTGNGAEGALRVQLPTFYVRPYVFGGAGWMHYSLVNTSGNVSLLPNRDDVFTVPLGVGVFARTLFGGTADVRGTIRLAYREQLFNGYYAGSGEHADLHTWGVTARLGWEF
jgi:outer membrane protein OmpA-like peptidoglycan-associated protein